MLPERERDTPKRLAAYLRIARERYPDAWRTLERFRAARGTPELYGVTWPAWCFVPLAASYAIVSDAGRRQVSFEDSMWIGILGALGTWRVSQGIYRFHPELFEELVATPPQGSLPVELLYRLPEWCVYLEVPQEHEGALAGLCGVFAHLEYDAGNARTELRLVLDDGQDLMPLPVHLREGGTIEQGVAAAIDTAAGHAGAVGAWVRDVLDTRYRGGWCGVWRPW